MGWYGYHGKSEAEHKVIEAERKASQHMPVTFGLSGSLRKPLYSSTWIPTDGRDWQLAYASNWTAFADRLWAMAQRRLKPIAITAGGDGQDAAMAAIVRRGLKVQGEFKTGLSYEQLNAELDSARKRGLLPVSIAQCHQNGQPSFAVLLFPNRHDPTNPAGIGGSPVFWDFQRWDPAWQRVAVEAHSFGAMRPAWISPDSNRFQNAIFRDDRVGPWVSNHDLAAADYQAMFNAHKATKRPISLQSAVVPPGESYSAVFAPTHEPAPRTLTVKGEYTMTGGTALDLAIIDFMKSQGIRAGTACVLKAGEKVFNRAYTWAEPGYPITQTNSRFRIASLSKLFVNAAIQVLKEAGKLTYSETLGFSDKALQKAQVTPPQTVDGSIDPRLHDITIQHLLDGSSGLQSGIEFSDVRRAVGKSWDLTRRDVIGHVLGMGLLHAPGALPPYQGYSNYGYVLLTEIVEKVAEKPFIDFLRDDVLAHFFIRDIAVGRARKGERLVREVRYDSWRLADPRAFASDPPELVPFQYGGYLMDCSEGAGGLVSSASAIAASLRHYAVWGVGSRTENGRTGANEGTWSWARSVTGDKDFVLLFNRFPAYGNVDKVLQDFQATVEQKVALA